MHTFKSSVVRRTAVVVPGKSLCSLNVFQLVRRANVPWIHTNSMLNVPSSQFFIPALDADKLSGVLGLGSAYVGTYTVRYPSELTSVPSEFTVRVRHDLPDVEVNADSDGAEIVVNTEGVNTDWLYDVIAVVRAAPPELVVGYYPPTAYPFVAVVDGLLTKKKVRIQYSELFESEYGTAVPIAYVEITVYAVPKLFSDQTANRALIDVIRAYEHMLTLQLQQYNMYNLSSFKALLAALLDQGKIKQEEYDKLVQATDAMIQFLHTVQNLAVTDIERPPLVPIGEPVRVYSLKLPFINKFSSPAALIFPHPAFSYSQVYWSKVLKAIRRGYVAYVALTSWDGVSSINQAMAEAEQNEVVRSIDKALNEVLGNGNSIADILRSAVENVSKAIGNLFAGVRNVFEALISLAASRATLEPGVDEKWIILPSSMFGGTDSDIDAIREDYTHIHMVGDVRQAVNALRESIVLPNDVSTVADRKSEGYGIKLYNISVRVPSGLKLPITVNDYIYFEYVSDEVLHHPVLGPVRIAVPRVDRNKVAAALGKKPEELAQYADLDLLGLLLGKQVDASVYAITAFITLPNDREPVDYIMFPGVPTLVPASVVKEPVRGRAEPAVAISPVADFIRIQHVNKNPDVKVSASSDSVLIHVAGWNYVRKLGFDMSLVMALGTTDQQTEVYVAQLYIPNALSPQSQPVTLEGELTVGDTRRKVQLSISKQGNTYTIDLMPVVSAVEQQVGKSGLNVMMSNAVLVPRFYPYPMNQSGRYSDVYISYLWPTVSASHTDREVRNLKLWVIRPAWAKRLIVAAYPIYRAPSGIRLVDRKAYKFDVDLSSTEAIELELDIRLQDGGKVKLGGDEVTVPYNSVITLDSSTLGDDYAGLALQIVDPLGNPVLLKKHADQVAAAVSLYVRRFDVDALADKLSEQQAQQYLKDITLPVEVYGTKLTINGVAIAGILQTIAFLYFGLPALGIVPSEGGYESDPNAALYYMKRAKEYATPYNVMLAMYYAGLVHAVVGKLADQLAKYNAKPVIFATPEQITEQLYSLIVMSPPDTAVVKHVDISTHQLSLTLSTQGRYSAIVKLYYDNVAQNLSEHYLIKADEWKTNTVKVPLRDLAFLASLGDRLAGMHVPKIVVSVGGFTISIGDDVYADVRKAFERVWDMLHTDARYADVYNALEIPEFRSALLELFQRLNQETNGEVANRLGELWDIMVSGIFDLSLYRVDVELPELLLVDALEENEIGGYRVFREKRSSDDQQGMTYTQAVKQVLNNAYGNKTLAQLVAEWAQSRGVMQLTDTLTGFLYYGNYKQFKVTVGASERTYEGYTRLILTDLLPMAVTLTADPNSADFKARVVAALTHGEMTDLIRVAGHSPYIGLLLKYDMPSYASALTTTLVYTVDKNKVLVPKQVERIRELLVFMPGTPTALFLISENKNQGQLVLPPVVLLGASEAVVLKQGVQLPQPADRVDIKVRPAIRMLLNHPTLYNPPKFVFSVEPVSGWDVDVSVVDYYEKQELVLYEGANPVYRIPLVSNGSLSFGPKEIADPRFFANPVYRVQYECVPSSKGRTYGNTVLDPVDNKVYGVVMLGVDAPSRSILSLKAGAVVNGLVADVVQTTGAIETLWDFYAVSYRNIDPQGNNTLSTVIRLYNPTISVSVDYQTKHIEVSASGVPSQLLQGFDIVAVYGKDEKNNFIQLEFHMDAGQFGRSTFIWQTLPRVMVVYPVVGLYGKTYRLVSSAVMVPLRQPDVKLAYDAGRNVVQAEVNDFGYSDKVKVQVIAASTDTWVVEDCLSREKPQTELQVDGKPLLVLGVVKDAYGVVTSVKTLLAPANRLYKSGNQYYVVINPYREAAVQLNKQVTDLENFLKLYSQCSTKLGSLTKYIAAGVGSSPLYAILTAGADTETLKVLSAANTPDEAGNVVVGNRTVRDILGEEYGALVTDALAMLLDEVKAYASCKVLEYLPGKYKFLPQLMYLSAANGFPPYNEILRLLHTYAEENADAAALERELGIAGISGPNDVLYKVSQPAAIVEQWSVTPLDFTKAIDLGQSPVGTSVTVDCHVVPQPPEDARPIKLFDSELYKFAERYGTVAGTLMLALAIWRFRS